MHVLLYIPYTYGKHVSRVELPLLSHKRVPKMHHLLLILSNIHKVIKHLKNIKSECCYLNDHVVKSSVMKAIPLPSNHFQPHGVSWYRYLTSHKNRRTYPSVFKISNIIVDFIFTILLCKNLLQCHWLIGVGLKN